MILAAIWFAVLAAIPVLGRSSAEKEIWAKNNTSRLTIPQDNPPLILRAGGPDRFGYFFIDSQDPARNAPRFRWVDITSIGTEIVMAEDDQNVGAFPVGFQFPFYGRDFIGFRVCSNGWISFTSESVEYLNTDIPDPGEPNNLLAVFWDDLLPGAGSHAYRYTNNRDSCIVAWHSYKHFPGTGSYTFEVILTANGKITYQYLYVGGTLDSHAIGIENSDGSIGLQYLNNTFRNETGIAIAFSLTPPSYADHDVLPTVFLAPATRGNAGSSIRPQVRITNSGIFTESFAVRVSIDHNGPVYGQSFLVNSLHPASSIDVSFPQFTPDESGIYRIDALTQLINDQVPTNDTLRMNYTAYDDMFSTDFEPDSGFFVGDHDWEWGRPLARPTPHSGSRLWGTVLDGDYTVGPLLSTLFPDTLILGSQASFSFWHWYDTEAMFDGGNVKISTDEGASWSIITPEGGYDGILSDAFGNPLGGQPAFSGVSNSWILETFDLSPYADSVVVIRFDFGSDNSLASLGWYIDDVTLLGGGRMVPGWIAGTVTDERIGNPIDSALVQSGRRCDTTDASGHYILRIAPGVHAVTATALYHNAMTVGDITVPPGDSIVLDFAMPSPGIVIDAAPVDTNLPAGQIGVLSRHIANDGSGALDFSVNIAYGPPIQNAGHAGQRGALDFGDELFMFDLQSAIGDAFCSGVEFDGAHFWVTGRHSVDDIHKLYQFDRDCNLVVLFDQNTTSTWGWRDLAFDGAYLYASDENELAIIDPSTGQRIGTLPMPSSIPPPLMGLAYDPQTDHFWAANLVSNIVEFDRDGQTLLSFPNNKHITGLAWDNASQGSPYLWVFSRDGNPITQVSQFNPQSGFYTGVQFCAIDHDGGQPDLAAGACFTTQWHPLRGVLICLVMGRMLPADYHDRVQGYEITPYSQWLRVAPPSGTIEPGGGLDLNITLDFQDTGYIPDSVYEAAITIANNSAETPHIPVTVGLLSGVNDKSRDLPVQFDLSQNYPNPFNSVTTISFALPEASEVRLDVYNILGQRVTTLIDGPWQAGIHGVTWDASEIASGIYYCKMTAGYFVKVGKMVLLK